MPVISNCCEISNVTANKKLAIFIPNYKRGKYIHATSSQFISSMSPNEWVVIIGNDGFDESVDISQLPENFFSFTIKRKFDETTRNGGFIRNFFIKRCRSKWILQKDPETVLQGIDWIKAISLEENENCFFRCNRIRVLGPESTYHYLTNKSIHDFPGLVSDAVNHDTYHHIHQMFGSPTKILQEIRGYDEDFVVYAPEDKDMHDRILARGLKEIFLDVTATHLWHTIDPMVYHPEHRRLINLSITKNPLDYVRNKNIEWGQLELV